jgi:hypothetical protein
VKLHATADPQAVATWTRQVQAERAAALASATTSATPAKLSEADIHGLIATLGDIHAVLREADPVDKARVYEGLQLHLTYQPAQQIVRAEANLDSHEYGAMGRVRGDSHHSPTTRIRRRGRSAGRSPSLGTRVSCRAEVVRGSGRVPPVRPAAQLGQLEGDRGRHRHVPQPQCVGRDRRA